MWSDLEGPNSYPVTLFTGRVSTYIVVLLGRHPEVVLADDVVAVEHAAGDVAGDGHGDSLGDTRAHNVPGGRATQVVEQFVGDPGSVAGGRRGVPSPKPRPPRSSVPGGAGVSTSGGYRPPGTGRQGSQ
jgi:hypothetical protein